VSPLSRSWMAWGSLAGSFLLLTAAKTPEQETLEVSRLLKPITDDRWKEIAKEQLNQDYEIIRGDTLWGVSQRLFGEGNYWPKLWALNGQSIPNPHWIRPGMKLIFTPGTGTSLPALTLADASRAASDDNEGAQSSALTATDAPRSQEWRDLPLQSWEQVQLQPPTEFDPDGFDRKIRLQLTPPRGMTVPQMVQTTQLPVLGTIGTAGSRNFALTQGEKVFLEPGETDSFQAGKILTITGRPNLVKSLQSGREGWAYPVEGLIRVLGQKQPEPLGSGLEGPGGDENGPSADQLAPSGGIWVGEIIASVSSAVRGNSILVDLPIQFQTPPLLAAPEAIKAILMVDRTSTLSVMAQHQVAFIDRGNEDGVRPGMIFRAYLDRDLHSLNPIGSDNLVSIADCRVLHVTERFSTVLITSSAEFLQDGTLVTALTDISEFFKKRGRQVKDFDGDLRSTPSNELDSLEEPGELSEEEKKNLIQLERKEEGETESAPVEQPETQPSTETETPPNLEETPTAPAPDLEQPAPEAAPETPLESSPDTSPDASGEPSPEPTPTETQESDAPADPEAPSEPSPEAPPDF